MSKDLFETRLEAMFDAPPSFDDGAVFAVCVERRVMRAVRWRADIITLAWIVALGAALFALFWSLDAVTVAAVTAQLNTAIGSVEDLGGVWLLPALAIGLVLAVQAIEDRWVRD